MEQKKWLSGCMVNIPIILWWSGNVYWMAENYSNNIMVVWSNYHKGLGVISTKVMNSNDVNFWYTALHYLYRNTPNFYEQYRNYYQTVWKHFFIAVGPWELLPGDVEIFLYCRGSPGIINRWHGNILILFWDPGNYYQTAKKYSYIIMGSRELLPDRMKIFLLYHGSLGIIPQRPGSDSHKYMRLQTTMVKITCGVRNSVIWTGIFQFSNSVLMLG